MAKLYPPYIEGTLPAFTSFGITVPFILNRAVSQQEVIGFNCKIKTINTNQNLAILYARNIRDTVWETQQITFSLSSSNRAKLNTSQSYKIQLACVSQDGQEEVEGYYSTVGIAKYTKTPSLLFNGLDATQRQIINATTGMVHSYTYIVDYSNEDKTEKLYSYRFDLLDNNNNLIDTSGELLHNSELDTDNHAIDQYEFMQDIPEGRVYWIQYTYQTMTNQSGTLRLKIYQNTTVANSLNAILTPTMNFDNGYVSIHLKCAAALSGTYRLVRTVGSLDGSDTLAWYPLATFNYDDTLENNEIFRDFTVTQGYIYTYGFYKENADGSGHRSNRIESEPITADFEDMFLYDGERQLRIRFNPQVSSFKTNILESKSEAIGAKYPFFFRNGRVAYKEFPINGLISYWMTDEEHSGLFLSDGQIGLEDGFDVRRRTKETQSLRHVRLRTTTQDGYNFAAERTFKLSVLDWLNDGKPKLFRSPGEGTYLVRLMGVSLSPEQQLSRLVHSFSCTAYEIGDTSYKTLIDKQNNILRLPEYDISYISVGQIDLSEATNNIDLFANKKVYSFYVDAISPGYSLTYSIQTGENITTTTEVLAIAAKEFKAPSGAYYTSLTINNLTDNPRGITIAYAYQDIPEIEGE